MAIVIVGGLVSSILLNLLAMPVMYWKFRGTAGVDIEVRVQGN